MTTDAYLRENEFGNVICYFNILFDEALCNWDSKKTSSDSNQLKLERMFRSKSIMAWTELVHDAICAKLSLFDSDDKATSMYRNLGNDEFNDIRFVIRRLVCWNIWDSPHNSEIDRILADNKSAVKKYLKGKGLTPGYLMGASE